jgi:hypothetical protein
MFLISERVQISKGGLKSTIHSRETENYCDALPGNGSISTFKHGSIEEAVFSMWSAFCNCMEAVFSLRGPCREDLREYVNRNSVQPRSYASRHSRLVLQDNRVELRRKSVCVCMYVWVGYVRLY